MAYRLKSIKMCALMLKAVLFLLMQWLLALWNTSAYIMGLVLSTLMVMVSCPIWTVMILMPTSTLTPTRFHTMASTMTVILQHQMMTSMEMVSTTWMTVTMKTQTSTPVQTRFHTTVSMMIVTPRLPMMTLMGMVSIT